MGFFKKNNKAEPPKTSVPKIEYADLKTSLVEALSVGSKDSKFLDVLTEDGDQIFIYANSGEIKYAYSKNNPLRFSERLFWVSEDSLSFEKREKLSTLVNDFSNVNFYAEIMKEIPESKDVVDGILRDYTLSVILNSKRAKITKIFTELLFHPENAIVENINFFEKSIDELIDEVEKLDKDENKFLHALSKNKDEKVSIALPEGFNQKPNNDIEYLLFSAAEAESTIAEVREASTGFVFAEVLSVLNSLIYNKVITIDEIGDDDDALPTFPFEETAEKESIVVSPKDEETESSNEERKEIPIDDYSTVISNDFDVFKQEPENKDLESTESDLMVENVTEEVESDSDDSDTHDSTLHGSHHIHPSSGMFEVEEDDEFVFAYPPKDSADDSVGSEDDGGFDFEVVEDAESAGTTGALDDEDFVKDFEKVLKDKKISEENRKEVRSLVENNDKLEIELKSVEQEVVSAQEEYNKSDSSAESDSDSHDSLSTLYEVESQRQEINTARKSVLERLFIITDSLPSDYVQEMLHRITLKLDGIESVVNVAFNVSEQEDVSESEVTIVNVTEEFEPIEEAVGIDAEEFKEKVEKEFHDVLDLTTEVDFSEESTPIYSELIKTMGFNPSNKTK